MGDAHVGLQARLMSQALRKLTAAISQVELLRDLHQPAPREDRRHVRQPRDAARRPGAQVLLLGAAGHPQGRGDQGRPRLGRRPGQGEGRQEQGRAAVPVGRVRHPVQRGHLARRRADRRGDRVRDLEKSGTWISYGDQRLGQGRENVRNYLRENPTLAGEIEAKVREKAAGGTPVQVSAAVKAPAACDRGVLAREASAGRQAAPWTPGCACSGGAPTRGRSSGASWRGGGTLLT